MTLGAYYTIIITIKILIKLMILIRSIKIFIKNKNRIIQLLHIFTSDV